MTKKKNFCQKCHQFRHGAPMDKKCARLRSHSAQQGGVAPEIESGVPECVVADPCWILSLGSNGVWRCPKCLGALDNVRVPPEARETSLFPLLNGEAVHLHYGTRIVQNLMFKINYFLYL